MQLFGGRKTLSRRSIEFLKSQLVKYVWFFASPLVLTSCIFAAALQQKQKTSKIQLATSDGVYNASTLLISLDGVTLQLTISLRGAFFVPQALPPRWCLSPRLAFRPKQTGQNTAVLETNSFHEAFLPSSGCLRCMYLNGSNLMSNMSSWKKVRRTIYMDSRLRRKTWHEPEMTEILYHQPVDAFKRVQTAWTCWHCMNYKIKKPQGQNEGSFFNLLVRMIYTSSYDQGKLEIEYI